MEADCKDKQVLGFKPSTFPHEDAKCDYELTEQDTVCNTHAEAEFFAAFSAAVVVLIPRAGHKAGVIFG